MEPPADSPPPPQGGQTPGRRLRRFPQGRCSERASPSRPPFPGGVAGASQPGGCPDDRTVGQLRRLSSQASHTIGEVPEGRRGAQGSAARGGVKRLQRLGSHLRLHKQSAGQMLSGNPESSCQQPGTVILSQRRWDWRTVPWRSSAGASNGQGTVLLSHLRWDEITVPALLPL